jgi:hypothetical protein
LAQEAAAILAEDVDALAMCEHLVGFRVRCAVF